MRNFDRGDKRSGGGNRFGGNKSFGGGARFGGRDGGARPTMHKATCSECGQPCEVPFRPTGERPIYCSNCFGKQQDGAGARPNRFSDDRRDRSRFDDKQLYSATCDKCGKPCQVPFRPTAGKPIYCDNCFGKGVSEPKDSGEVMRELKMLSSKIDQLIKVLAPKAITEKVADLPKIVKEVKVKKVVKAKTKVVAKKAAVKKKK